MAQGWIKLHRKIKDCDLWNDNEPYDRRSAWIDLLLSANHETRNVLLGNEVILVEKGSFITSVRKLCDRWKWSNTKVTSFLKLLNQMDMIDYNSDTKKTVVTIANWAFHQDTKDTETSEERHESDTETTQKHTNKNDKNDKNDKNEKNIKKQQQGFDSVINSYTNNPALKETIFEFIKMRKTIKKPMTDAALKLLLRNLDKLATNDEKKIAILNQSIVNSWQGVFELKDNQSNQGNFKKTGTDNGTVIQYKDFEFDD